MNEIGVARELVRIVRTLMASDRRAMDFPDQKSLDRYLKEHPDADKSKHRVVKHDSKKPETHSYNLMRQRKNEKALGDMAKNLKKKPEDLTVDEIMKFNQSKGKKGSRRTAAYPRNYFVTPGQGHVLRERA